MCVERGSSILPVRISSADECRIALCTSQELVLVLRFHTKVTKSSIRQSYFAHHSALNERFSPLDPNLRMGKAKLLEGWNSCWASGHANYCSIDTWGSLWWKELFLLKNLRKNDVIMEFQQFLCRYFQ